MFGLLVLMILTILNEKKSATRKRKRKKIWNHWFAPTVYGLLFSECLNISHLYCEWLMNTSLASIRSQAHIFTRHFHFNFESIYVPLYRCGYRAERWTSHWCRLTFPTRHLHPTFPFRKWLKYAIAQWNERMNEWTTADSTSLCISFILTILSYICACRSHY